MRIVGVDHKGKDESAALIHSCGGHASVCQKRKDVTTFSIHQVSGNAARTAYRTFVWGNGECEVEEISGIWEMRLHGRWEVEFCQVWNMCASEFLSARDQKRIRPTFLYTNLGRAGLWLLLSGRLLGLLHAPYLWWGQIWSKWQMVETYLDHRAWMVGVVV